MTSQTKTNATLMAWAAKASVVVAVTLVGGKTLAYWMSLSTAMLGSLTDSALDLAASLVTLFAVKTALTPADDEHRFGHGKAEALAGLFQAGLMGASAVFLLAESVSALVDYREQQRPDLVIFVSVVSIVLTVVLVAFQAYVIRTTGSIAIAGDHLHYKGDLFLNLGVVVAAGLSVFGLPMADPVIGAAIAFYILHGGYHVGRPAVDMLMDRELDDADRAKIMDIVQSTEGVHGVHALKTRQAGQAKFVQMHIEVDGEISVNAGHSVAETVEERLTAALTGADILIHIDPVGVGEISVAQQELGLD